jgi:anaerobic selenocysteine-containing dehydrogenase
VPEDVRSYCRICAAACGIVVTVDGDRVLRVRGDDDHPLSRGYTCTKGRGLPVWHHGTDRLDRPRIRGDGATWDAVLTDLAARLGAVVRDHGPDAVSLYLATGLAYDAAGQIAASRWLSSIGSHSFVTAVTVDNAPVLVAAELVTGEPMLNPVWDPSAPGVTVFVGTNPVVSHGYGTALPDPVARLRRHRAAGGRVWVLDPRRSETAALADHHVAVRPGADVAVLGALARAVLEDGADARELHEHCRPHDVAALRAALEPFTIERAARVADVGAPALARLVEDVRGARGRLAMHCGTGVTMQRDGVLAEWLRWVILIATGSLDRPGGGMQFHRGTIQPFRRRPATLPAHAGPPAAASRPELPRILGQVPAVALADEIERGTIRALVVTGGNPLTAFPEPDRLRAALGRLDVLAVVDVAENDLTRLATHVLPATGQLERADLTLAEPTALRGGLQATRPVVAPVAERRPVWWMLARLDAAMGRPAPGGVDPDLLTDELYLRGVLGHAGLDADAVFAAGPHGLAATDEPGWVHADLLPDGCWSIAPAPLLARLVTHADPDPGGLVLAPRREAAWSNSVAYGARAGAPEVRVAPDAIGCAAGATVPVVLRTRSGAVRAAAIADPAVRAGVVSMTHGRPAVNPGDLTSAHAGVDPLTAMPRVAGLPVAVETPDG